MEDVPVPSFIYVWYWYLDMRGHSVLTCQEIESWGRLMKRELCVWEVELIRSLDRMYWKVMAHE